MLLNVIKSKMYRQKVLVLVSAILFAKLLLLILKIFFTSIVDIPAEKAVTYQSDWLWNTILTAEFDKPDCRLHANEVSWWYKDWVWCRVTAAQCLPSATSFTTDKTAHMDMHCQLPDVSMNWEFSYEEPCSIITCTWYKWLNLRGQLNVDLSQVNGNLTLT